MAGRAFAFADPKILELVKAEMIPVSMNDWYARRRTDDEGQFYKKIYRQSPRPTEVGTHQGIYVVAPDGELLGFRNAGNSIEATLKQFQDALAKWKAKPAAARQPFEVPAHGPLDAKYTRTPPVGGLVLGVNARILDQTPTGYIVGTSEFAGADRAARDFCWLTAAEVKSLIPESPTVGQTRDLPTPIRTRIVRYHLVDNTRGEPDHWKDNDIQTATLKLTVSAVSAETIDFQMTGAVKLKDPERSFDVDLRGELRFDRKTHSFTRFDLVALGMHAGDTVHTRTGTRPGRTPLGIVFQKIDSTRPTNQIAPQGMFDKYEYFRR